jgi:hypothetical protein
MGKIMLKKIDDLKLKLRKRDLLELLISIKKDYIKGLKSENDLISNLNNIPGNIFHEAILEKSSDEDINKMHNEICSKIEELISQINQILNIDEVGPYEMERLIESIDQAIKSLNSLAQHFKKTVDSHILKLIIIKNLGG